MCQTKFKIYYNDSFVVFLVSETERNELDIDEQIKKKK
jgi:hypothetical protein